MPRRCTVCAHPERDTIERAVLARRPYRKIASQYGLTDVSIIRHRPHLSEKILTSSRIAEITRADDLVDRLISLALETQAVLARAKEAGNDELVLKAVARAEKQLELQARLLGELKDAPVFNLIMSPEWAAVQAVLIEAVNPYPEARQALTSALVHVAG
jgi:hypothetical protein